ncbi:fasciclin domain-containing protein [Chryseobacterium sp. MFBS3-17]|uniref:fasciclin domain-containing protein n=1 Tax=Chryseobacterium sp. MFBS3-17 TaxID=2886689 RepID=UPI001D0F089D|nr:fasciclin domain-containing protein [Chryseobacterium sp. MFBS3-17]MCC2590891.1 fasciclin domain-containing protein [Chryseobacterium sp. MFBS3-17]
MNKSVLILGMLGFALLSCSQNESKPTAPSGDVAEATLHGQDGIVDEVSNPNIVQLAVKNPDLSTLVTAVQTANLATSLSNAGPFTVFAPLNAAFDKLPAGTVDGLLKPDKADDLNEILSYHTYVGVIKEDQMTDGLRLGMVNGKSITITLQDGKPVINGKAKIVATVPASNGIVYAIDEVLLPE